MTPSSAGWRPPPAAATASPRRGRCGRARSRSTTRCPAGSPSGSAGGPELGGLGDGVAVDGERDGRRTSTRSNGAFAQFIAIRTVVDAGDLPQVDRLVVGERRHPLRRHVVGPLHLVGGERREGRGRFGQELERDPAELGRPRPVVLEALEGDLARRGALQRERPVPLAFVASVDSSTSLDRIAMPLNAPMRDSRFGVGRFSVMTTVRSSGAVTSATVAKRAEFASSWSMMRR